MICLDASVAAKMILDEEKPSDRALALYTGAVRTGELTVVPPMLPIEVTNILRQRMHVQDGISVMEATRLLDKFLTLPITIHNPAWLHREARALADTRNLPAAYDAHYLVSAEHLGCKCWRDDQHLLRRVGDSLPFVRPIADYNLMVGT
jgi:predicted nucleic acid-binding protein